MKVLHNLLPIQYKNPSKLLSSISSRDAKFWNEKGEKRVIQLFHEMARLVPAYKAYLRQNKVNPNLIKTISDLKEVPPVDKDNYLRKYHLSELCWRGVFNKSAWVISTTSGSTGEPFYFPRQKTQDEQYAVLAELYLLTNFQIDKKTTLYIVGFPMGAWIGGVFTYEALRQVVERGGYALSIITPGIHKQEILHAVNKLGSKFDQIIIGSYGPFLKDILDDGIKSGINWKKYDMKFIFSAEGFTEGFRDYIMREAGCNNIYTSTLNHYGTVDLGTMSYETPMSILIRRLALENNSIYKELFGDTIKLPTLTQYFPDLFYFEEDNNNLLCSAYSGIPLVRYNLKDHGGIIQFNKVVEIFSSHGIDLLKEARRAKISETIWKLPFVYVFERADFSVSFHAFRIYPETIRRALQKSELEKYITGKFTMMIKYDKLQNQYLEINVELKGGIKKSITLKNTIKIIVSDQLIKESSEYRETWGHKGKSIAPHIKLYPYENELYFKPGTKQKWISK